MQALQMYTMTVPSWGTALILLFFVYLSIGMNINKYYYLPVHYVPMRLLPGAVAFIILGYLMPRVRFQTFTGLSSLTGALPSGKDIGLLIAVCCTILSVISWGIYAMVRPKEKRSLESSENESI